MSAAISEPAGGGTAEATGGAAGEDRCGGAWSRDGGGLYLSCNIMYVCVGEVEGGHTHRHTIRLTH